jgi:hypothetical protein
MNTMDFDGFRRFALAGNATFTVVSLTGNRFTYRVRASKKDAAIRFVSLLTGSNNETNYSFLGVLIPTQSEPLYRHANRSDISPDAPGAKGFAWFWERIAQGRLPSNVTVHHEGRCGRCGRKLTVPESIASGLGPECATMME